MYKLATTAVLTAVLAAPAAAVGHGAQHAARAARLCNNGPVFLSAARDYTFCGPQVFRGTVTVWVRDPETGKIVPVPGSRWKADPPYGP
jgi:hypothetical protein